METQPAPAAEELAASRAGRRRIVDRYRRAAVIAAGVTVLAAAAWLTYFYWPGPDLTPPTLNWYSVDDGATWFPDDAERIPPFDHEGKPAVRLHLYSCDGGKHTFVGYLQKLPEEVFSAFRARGLDPEKVDDDDLAAEGGWLAKRAGAAEWVNSKADHAAYLAIVRVTSCPGNPGGKPVEVFPKNPKK